MAKFTLADTALHASEAKVRRCYLGKVLYVLNETSNWTGRCGFKNEDLESLQLDWRDAVTWINPRRKRGKSWHIIELPMVVLESSENESLLIGELSLISPLSEFGFKLPRKKTFGMLAGALMPACTSGQYGLQCDGVMQLAEFPFLVKRTPSPEDRQASKIMGDPALIPMVDWPRESHVDAQPTIRLVSEICLWLAEDK